MFIGQAGVSLKRTAKFKFSPSYCKLAIVSVPLRLYLDYVKSIEHAKSVMVSVAFVLQFVGVMKRRSCDQTLSEASGISRDISTCAIRGASHKSDIILLASVCHPMAIFSWVDHVRSEGNILFSPFDYLNSSFN